jgi:GntR family transcriptional regulator/MocR family aminotransferase
VRWAREAGAIVIEDDYDGEFRYDRQPVGALQGLDPERVVYTGTASKTLAPGLRLGWMAVPHGLLNGALAVARQRGRHTGVLDHLTMAELIGSGAYDRHVRRMRAHYRRRRDLLVAALAARVPALRPIGVAAGLNALLPLPPGGPTEAEVIARAASRGIALYALSPSWHGDGPRPEGLVIGYATPPEHAFPSALSALVDVLAELYPA